MPDANAMNLSFSLLRRGLRGGLTAAATIWLLAGAYPAGAVLPEIKRLASKSAPGFTFLGGEYRLAMGAGIVAAGAPNLMNPKTGVITGGVLLWDARTGKELPTLFPPPGSAAANVSFGWSVAMSGSTLVIGAPYLDSASGAVSDVGGAFVYDVKARRFLTAQPLRAPWAEASDHFGERVAVDGDLVALGSLEANGQGANAAVDAGAVLAVNFRTGDYSRITPDAVGLPGATLGNATDSFSWGLALRGRVLAVGAPGAEVSAVPVAGRIYVISVNLGPAAGPGGASALLTEVTESAPQAFVNYGQKLALGSRFLVTGSPNQNSGAGQVRVFDARGLPALPEVATYTGGVPGDNYGLAVATEGNRVFLTYDGRYVAGLTIDSPFTRQQVFFTWDTESQGYGQALTLADERLAVGQPSFDGPAQDSGAVVLHPTTTLHGPDFFLGPLTGDSAPSMPGDARLTKFQEVVLTLRPPTAYPAGNPLCVGSLSGGVPGVKSPLGVFEHDSSLTISRALSQSTTDLPRLSRPIANHPDATWFRAGPKGKGPPNLMWVNGSNPPEPVLHGGDGVLFGVNLPVASVGELRVDNIDAGRGLAPARLKQGGGPVDAGNDSALLDVAASNTLNSNFFLREGDDLGVGVLGGEVAPRGAFTSFTLSFMTGLTGTGVTPDTNQLVLAGSLTALKGDTAPGVLDKQGNAVAVAAFQQFTGETHGPSVSGLIRAVVRGAGVTAAVNEGLWSNRSASLALILQKGQQAPLLAAGVKIKRLLNYAMLRNDDILVLAQVAGPGVKAGNDGVLYRSELSGPEPGVFEILAREGDRLQGLGGAKIATILRLEATTGPMNSDRSRYGVLCSLVSEPGRVTPKNNLVWAVGAPDLGDPDHSAVRLPLPKLRKGEFCEVFGPGYDRVTSFSFPAMTRDATGVLHTGMAQVIDYRHGGSTGVVTFPNKRQSAVLIW